MGSNEYLVVGALLVAVGVIGTLVLIVTHREEREFLDFTLGLGAFLVGALGMLLIVYALGERQTDAYRRQNPLPICGSGTPSAAAGEACWVHATPER